MCARLNHREVMKAEPSRLIPFHLAAHLEHLVVESTVFCWEIYIIESNKKFIVTSFSFLLFPYENI